MSSVALVQRMTGILVIVSDHAAGRAIERVATFADLSLKVARERIRQEVLRALAGGRISCAPRNGPARQGTCWRFANAPGAVYVIRRRRSPDGSKSLIVLTTLEAPPNLPRSRTSTGPHTPPPTTPGASLPASRARPAAGGGPTPDPLSTSVAPELQVSALDVPPVLATSAVCRTGNERASAGRDRREATESAGLALAHQPVAARRNQPVGRA